MKQLLVTLTATFIAFLLAEGFLQILGSFSGQRSADVRSDLFRYDSQLGWRPKENSGGEFMGSRKIQVEHNSLGFRDREIDRAVAEHMVVIGDSFVWGYDVNHDERFTEELQRTFADIQVVNAGVSGFGNDQELLILKEVLPKLRAKLVLLIYTPHNDREENSSDIAHAFYYKPYFVAHSERGPKIEGQPVPRSFIYRLQENGLEVFSRSLVFREVARAYYAWLRKTVPDPTHFIFDALQQECLRHGASLLVGLVSSDHALEQFLLSRNITHVVLNDAERYPSHGRHWTPAGHVQVAAELSALISRQWAREKQ